MPDSRKGSKSGFKKKTDQRDGPRPSPKPRENEEERGFGVIRLPSNRDSPRAHRRNAEFVTQSGRSSQSDSRAAGKPGGRPGSNSTLKPKAKKEALEKAFSALWSSLFQSPTHLDSVLSKQPPTLKSLLAQITPMILLRPASQAEALGIGLAPDEPWSLNAATLAHWKPAALIAERLYEAMTSGMAAAPAIMEDFPPSMIKEWEKEWGKEKARELSATLGSEAPLSLRAAREFGAASLLKELKQGDALPVKAELSDLSPVGVRLSGYTPVLGTDLYKEGQFEIQDEGSQVMALFALMPERFAARLQKTPGKAKGETGKIAPLPEMPAITVIDACAGAGGKSLALGDLLGGRGRLYAYDTSEKKLQALRRRVSRAGLRNVQAVAVKEGDEAASIKRFRRTAQVVLVDAPCSGWGVLRRNPDIKWRQSSEVLERMPKIQLRLLELYSSLVAPGGRLVYGVCTFRKAETVAVVEAFLSQHPEFTAAAGGYLGPGTCDGFFMQAFDRK